MKLRIAKYQNGLLETRWTVEKRFLGCLFWVGVDDYGSWWNYNEYSEYVTHKSYDDALKRLMKIRENIKSLKWKVQGDN